MTGDRPEGLQAVLDLRAWYDMQLECQRLITGEEQIPRDSVEWFGYHIKLMLEELGELLSADKRWKTHRNEKFDPENKLEELSDVIIIALNLCIFSGLDADELYTLVKSKITKNVHRWRTKDGNK